MNAKLTDVIKSDDFISLLDERAQELTRHIKAMNEGKSIDGKSLSKATIHTQTYQKSRERKIIRLLISLLQNSETFHINPSDRETLVLLSTLMEENKRVGLEVHKGDSVMDIMLNNPKATMDKILKAAEKAGLEFNPTTGKLE